MTFQLAGSTDTVHCDKLCDCCGERALHEGLNGKKGARAGKCLTPRRPRKQKVETPRDKGEGL